MFLVSTKMLELKSSESLWGGEAINMKSAFFVKEHY